MPTIDRLTSHAPLLTLLRDLTAPRQRQRKSGFCGRAPARWLAHLRNEPVLIPRSVWAAGDDRADIIVADRAPDGALSLHLGVRTDETVLWLRDYRLFMPASGPAVFVPAGFGTGLHLRIDENGWLEAREGAPYATHAEYQAGCGRADMIIGDRLGHPTAGMAIAC